MSLIISNVYTLVFRFPFNSRIFALVSSSNSIEFNSNKFNQTLNSIQLHVSNSSFKRRFRMISKAIRIFECYPHSEVIIFSLHLIYNVTFHNSKMVLCKFAYCFIIIIDSWWNAKLLWCERWKRKKKLNDNIKCLKICLEFKYSWKLSTIILL